MRGVPLRVAIRGLTDTAVGPRFAPVQAELVDGQGPALHLAAAEGGDGVPHLVFLRHGNEDRAPRTAGFPAYDEADAIHGTESVEAFTVSRTGHPGSGRFDQRPGADVSNTLITLNRTVA